MNINRSTDRFKKTAFSKQLRKLTQAVKGPDPAQYNSHDCKDKQVNTIHPRAKFTLASRKIDVIKCK